MVFLEEKEISKMNFKRLKEYRTSVIAHISKYYESTGTECLDLKPVDHDSQEYKDAKALLKTVNKYYDVLKLQYM